MRMHGAISFLLFALAACSAESPGPGLSLSDPSGNEQAEQSSHIPIAEPRWQVVQDFLDAQEARYAMGREIRENTASRVQSARMIQEELPPLPDFLPAVASAAAIVRLDGDHEKTVDAARFLVVSTPEEWSGTVEAVTLGITALIEHAPADYGYNWFGPFNHSSGKVQVGESAAVDHFIENFETIVENSPYEPYETRLWAAHRYMGVVNDPARSVEEREAARARGIELLSDLEDEPAITVIDTPDAGADPEYDGSYVPPAEDRARGLLAALKFYSTGNSLAGMEGETLDGRKASISEYSGKVVLVDFWTTACIPCIADIPVLTDLRQELSDESFALLSINGDKELDTVLDFQSEQPMPWDHWHADFFGPLFTGMGIQGVPTYFLLDENAQILARSLGMSDELLELVRSVVSKSERESHEG